MRLLTGQDDLVGLWVHARLDSQWFPGMGRAIGILKDDALIAGITYSSYNGVTVWADIATDGSKRWATRSTLWAIFHYPFVQLRVKWLRCRVAATNSASRRMVERLGFQRETSLQEADPSGDVLIYRMALADCRWIERKPNGQEQHQTATAA